MKISYILLFAIIAIALCGCSENRNDSTANKRMYDFEGYNLFPKKSGTVLFYGKPCNSDRRGISINFYYFLFIREEQLPLLVKILNGPKEKYRVKELSETMFQDQLKNKYSGKLIFISMVAPDFLNGGSINEYLYGYIKNENEIYLNCMYCY